MGSLELRGIPMHGSCGLQPSTTWREQHCLVQHQLFTSGALPASPPKLLAICVDVGLHENEVCWEFMV